MLTGAMIYDRILLTTLLSSPLSGGRSVLRELLRKHGIHFFRYVADEPAPPWTHDDSWDPVAANPIDPRADRNVEPFGLLLICVIILRHKVASSFVFANVSSPLEETFTCPI